MNILSCLAILSCIIGLYTGVSILLSKDCDKSEKTFGVLALVWSVFTIFMNIAAMKVFIVPTLIFGALSIIYFMLTAVVLTFCIIIWRKE